MRRSTVKRIYILIIAYALAVLLLGVSVMTPSVSSSEDFSIYNSSWNGCSDLAKVAYEQFDMVPNVELVSGDSGEVTVVQSSFVEYDPDPVSTSMLIIGPSDPFTSSEVNHLYSFIERGGTVLLADDFGTGGELLEQMNTSLRLEDREMLDLAFQKKPDYSMVIDMAEHPVTKNLTALLLNHPTVVTAGPEITAFDKGSASRWGDNSSFVQPLFNSSSASWMDRNSNGAWDGSEVRGPFTICAFERIGEGELIVLADPSLLINSMTDKLDNQEFRDNLLEYLTRGGKNVFIDESHRGGSSPLSLTSTISNLPTMAKFVILALFTLTFSFAIMDVRALAKTMRLDKLYAWVQDQVGGLVRRLSRKQVSPEAPDRDEVLSAVIGRHPDWDERVLRQLLDNII